MNTLTKLFNRTTVLLLLAALLAGCASGRMKYDQGVEQLDQGKVQEGFASLQEAVKLEPDNPTYRMTLLRRREQYINQQLITAYSERASGHPDVARTAYEMVLQVDQKNVRAKDGLRMLEMDKRHKVVITRVKEQAAAGELDAARETLKPVLLEDPDNEEAFTLQRKIGEQIAKRQSESPALKSQFKKPVTMEFRDANIKMVFEALSRTSGINVLLDKDVRPDLKTSISVRGESVEDAIDLIIMQNDLEKKIINDNTVFIYPNSPQKIKEYQELKVRSFHLVYADAKQMESMIKTLLKTKDIFLNERTNSIVMRDTPAAISLAEKMVSDQDVPDPEVMLEVEVLEVSQSRLSQLGIAWPNQFSVTATGAGATPTINELKRINGDRIITSPALSVTLDAMMQDSDTKILANPRIRVRSHEKAKIMIGDRVPVITNAVTPIATGTPVVTGSVQYLDVGLKLEVEPDVHPNNDVAIKINMDVSSIAKEVQNAVSGTLAYQIGTRNTTTMLQLKDGETQILAGLIDDEDRETANKVPGISQLPVLGRLFSDNNNNNTKTEIVLSITPHIVGRYRLPEAEQTEYWSGTEQTLRDSRFLLNPARPVAIASQAAQPAALPVPETPPAPAVMSLIWQGPEAAKTGDKVSLTLNVQAGQGLNDLGVLVNFDPAVLRIVDVAEGNLLKQGNAQTRFTKSFDQAKGQAMLELTGSGAGGGSGSGSVFTIVFEVAAEAEQTQVTLGRIAPKGAGGRELAYSPPQPYLLKVSK